VAEAGFAGLFLWRRPDHPAFSGSVHGRQPYARLSLIPGISASREGRRHAQGDLFGKIFNIFYTYFIQYLFLLYEY
jgi:hypothetical protein